LLTENLAPKRRVDEKPEPCWLKTWPQKGDYMQTTKLNRGGLSPGPKKAIRRQTWVLAASHLAPKRRLHANDKPESWRPLTWPQKDDYMQTTKLNRGGLSPGPKKAITCKRQSWTVAGSHLAPKRRLHADDKVEPWRVLTWPQKGDGCNLSLALLCLFWQVAFFINKKRLRFVANPLILKREAEGRLHPLLVDSVFKEAINQGIARVGCISFAIYTKINFLTKWI